ncbi:MAG: DUF2334 domain-containing protein [Firmicutes bacterium]|nr:DUF2334 domain-containing protein [Bacillota bacterium]
MLRRYGIALILLLAMITATGRLAAQGYWTDDLLVDLPREIKGIIHQDTAPVLSKTSTAANPNRSDQKPVPKWASRKVALIRLEDVGPGGNYSSLEDLGRLRAVVDYLYSEGIPYHVTVIPRYKTLNPDGTWKNNGIDDPNPTPETQAFIRMLYYMKEHGGILGAHGYTHQYGESQKPDNGQNTGTGNEFGTGESPTDTLEYAQVRVELAARAFQQLNLDPEFWETPHNVATPEQREVFRSAFGIQYESLNKKDLNTAYLEGENQFQGTNLGSVYVPTPLYYVEGGTGTAYSVERILRRMVFFSGLASFFFHPFLEYQFLEPVTTPDGKPVIEDGLPRYRYREVTGSYLQRMVKGLEDWGYRFTSIHEVVPFTPGHRLRLAEGEESQWLTGDFNGDRRAELLVKEGQRVKVAAFKLQTPRWNASTHLSEWLEIPEDTRDSVVKVGDFNRDGRDDLLFYQPFTSLWSMALSDGERFGRPRLALAGWPSPTGMSAYTGDYNGDGFDDLLVFNPEGQNWQIALNNQAGGFMPQEGSFFGLGESSLEKAVGDVDGDGTNDLIAYNTTLGRVQVALIKDGKIDQPQTWLANGERFRDLFIGDFNGDARCDVLLGNTREGAWSTYLSDGERMAPTLQPYGPWAPGTHREKGVSDFNGDGRADLVSVEKRSGEWLVDLSYSYQD